MLTLSSQSYYRNTEEQTASAEENPDRSLSKDLLGKSVPFQSEQPLICLFFSGKLCDINHSHYPYDFQLNLTFQMIQTWTSAAAGTSQRYSHHSSWLVLSHTFFPARCFIPHSIIPWKKESSRKSKTSVPHLFGQQCQQPHCPDVTHRPIPAMTSPTI